MGDRWNENEIRICCCLRAELWNRKTVRCAGSCQHRSRGKILIQRMHKDKVSGFSLVELILAMSITLVIGMAVFEIFLQSVRVFEDQGRIMEMRQSTRAVASMIAADLQRAGQGVPLYSAAQDLSIAEAVQTFLDGTDADNLRFRAGIRNVTTTVSVPLAYSGTTVVSVADVSRVWDIVGTDANLFVYLWGPAGNTWTWIRGEVSAINTGAQQLSVTLSHNSGQGTTFSGRPRLVLEEGISYRLDRGSVLRGMTTDFSSLTAPTFTEQSVGTRFTELSFSYYDASGSQISPTTLALRSAIRRVGITVGAETLEELSTSAVDNYAITLSVYPRNLAID